jgi:type II secretory ATPase GspE/PulE/Tfp pilus assembly ATPase PilB-like protein
VRRICPACAQPVDNGAKPVSRLLPPSVKNATLMHGRGCSACRGTGYSGRVGVFELISLTDAMRDAIARGAPRSELQVLAETSGWRRLLEDAWTKVALGLTTVEEALRVGAI